MIAVVLLAAGQGTRMNSRKQKILHEVGGRPMVLPEDVQAVFPAVAGHRLAGGARAGAPVAASLLRAVPLP